MKLTFDIFSILNLLGVIQGLIVATILMAKHRKSGQRDFFYLSLMFANASITTVYGVLISTSLSIYLPYLLLMCIPFKFLIGPALYVYIKALFGVEITKREGILHLAAALGLIVVFVLFFFLLGDRKLIEIANSFFVPGDHSFAGQFIWFSFCVHLGIYTLFTFILYRSFDHSYRDKIFTYKKRWSLFLLLVNASLGISLLAISLLYYGNIFSLAIYRIIPVAASTGIFIISYAAHHYIHQLQINTREKYSEARLDEDFCAKEFAKIQKIMDEEKLYLDSDFSMQQLSKKSGIKLHYLSQIINLATGNNFYHLINNYRIEYAKRHLDQNAFPDHTIIRIAYDSGFGSKATFNNVFKKMTTMTPSEYRKSLEKKSHPTHH